MDERIRPVVPGMILGVLGLIFGIFWAIYLVVGHEALHKSLESRRPVKAASETQVPAGVEKDPDAAPMHTHAHGKGNDVHEHGSHVHKGPTPREVGRAGHSHEEAMAAHHEGPGEGRHGHDDELMDEAHERLARGHIHEMGLGVLTIAVSFILAFSSAPNMIKIFASLCLGFGGLLYPLAWILAGYRTTAMGVQAAQDSTLPIVAASVPLVLLGLFITLFYLLAALFRRR